jgi:acyl-coenzyme A thioesterase PaaI-like protein
MKNLGTTEPRTSDAAKYRSHLDKLKRPKMPNIAQLQTFIANNMPRSRLQIDALSERGAILTYTVDPSDYGHNDNVSGPAIMGMADAAFYVVLLAQLGFDTGLTATNLNFSFLHKAPGSCNLKVHCNLLKMGGKTIVGELYVYSDSDKYPEPVAHATGSYMILGTK